MAKIRNLLSIPLRSFQKVANEVKEQPEKHSEKQPIQENAKQNKVITSGGFHGGQSWQLCGSNYIADASVTTNMLGAPR